MIKRTLLFILILLSLPATAQQPQTQSQMILTPDGHIKGYVEPWPSPNPNTTNQAIIAPDGKIKGYIQSDPFPPPGPNTDATSDPLSDGDDQ